MEFGGEGLASLSIADRIALCNLCVEAGAKTGLCEVDAKTLDYLKAHGREPVAVLNPDKDADYEEVFCNRSLGNSTYRRKAAFRGQCGSGGGMQRHPH